MLSLNRHGQMMALNLVLQARSPSLVNPTTQESTFLDIIPTFFKNDNVLAIYVEHL
jgi:hypothetical protein